MLRSALLLICCLMPCVLSACSLMSPAKQRPINTYTLTAQPGPMKPASSRAGILLISKPTASPGLTTSNMLYRQTAYQLDHFAYHRWAGPPPDMLAPLLLQHLERAGCFAAVVAPPFPNDTAFTLQTNIAMFQQEFTDCTSHAKVAVNVSLIDNNANKVKQTWIEASVPTSANTPYAGVVATNEAVAMVLQKVTRFVCANAQSPVAKAPSLR